MPSPIADQAHIHIRSEAEQSAFAAADHLATSEQKSQLPAVVASSPSSHLTGSPSYNTGTADGRNRSETIQNRGPIPADFTQYQSQDTGSGTASSHLPSRKRSISATEEFSGTPNNPIINAARQAAVVTAIDPSLTDADAMTSKDPPISSPNKSSHAQTIVQSSYKNSNSGIHQGVVDIRDLAAAKQKDHRQLEMNDVQRRKEERKRNLEAEARRMREALDAKERELLALDEDGEEGRHN